MKLKPNLLLTIKKIFTVMKATNNNTMVEIPSMTLTALKGLLFSNEGIDLSAIVDDMSVGMEDSKKDLLAINVALTFKGLKPKMEIGTKFQYDWQNRYFKYQYVGYSLIEQTIFYNKTRITVTEEGTEEETDMGKVGFGFGVENWDELSTIVDKINNYWDRQKASK